MSLSGPYIHNIDPIFASLCGIHLWWYGLSYTLGFLNAHLSISRQRLALKLSPREVLSLSLLLSGGVLVGGRFIEVVFYEWPFYRANLRLIPALWLGGMATHGLLFGGLFGVWLFCRIHRKDFLTFTDALAIPAAFILGVGRIGNFIDGQIVGSVTSVWWAVKFPDVESYRHPVVLYDGLKNLLIIPLLVWARARGMHRGFLTGAFLFLYAFLRIFIDVFREYPTSLLGLATGQVMNIALSCLGLLLLLVPQVFRNRSTVGVQEEQEEGDLSEPATWWQMGLFGLLLLFVLVIPSDWTQDVPKRYGSRHAGLEHSAMYPVIDTRPSGMPDDVSEK